MPCYLSRPTNENYAMKNDSYEMALLCQKCGSIDTSETGGSLIAGWLLKLAGYRSFYCKNCGYYWNQLLPLNTLLNLIYLLLVIEVGFLISRYMR